jgi:hypothetical protein
LGNGFCKSNQKGKVFVESSILVANSAKITPKVTHKEDFYKEKTKDNQ